MYLKRHVLNTADSRGKGRICVSCKNDTFVTGCACFRFQTVKGGEVSYIRDTVSYLRRNRNGTVFNKNVYGR